MVGSGTDFLLFSVSYRIIDNEDVHDGDNFFKYSSLIFRFMVASYLHVPDVSRNC